MNRNILAAAAAIALNVAIATPASALTPEDRAREAAEESPQALRSFVHRTRMIYALNIQDFSVARDEEPVPTEAMPTAAPEGGRDNDKEMAELREQIYRDMMHE
jgi:hypothetical protein